MIQRTFVMIKPDGVKRTVVGEIMARFEKKGLRLIGLKMVWIDEAFGKKHYHDIAARRGEKVLTALLKYVREGPVVAMVWEGINAIEVVRATVGPTEPKSAPPGTIRGDYAHVSYGYADSKDLPIKNLIHASGNKEDAAHEIPLWFSTSELFEYSTVHDVEIR